MYRYFRIDPHTTTRSLSVGVTIGWDFWRNGSNHCSLESRLLRTGNQLIWGIFLLISYRGCIVLVTDSFLSVNLVNVPS